MERPGGAGSPQPVRIFDIGSTDDRSYYELRNVQRHALAQLVHVAQPHGRETTQALWQEYERRWQDRLGQLRHKGHQILPAALETGIIARGAILRWARELETLVQSNVQGGEAPNDLTKLAGTMVAVGRVADSRSPRPGRQYRDVRGSGRRGGDRWSGAAIADRRGAAGRSVGRGAGCAH